MSAGEVPKAVVVLRPDVRARRTGERCRERLADYKVSKTVDVVAEQPRNPTGRVLKWKLRKP